MWKKREESYSNWREDLREIVQQPETDKESEKEVTEKKVNNKVVINPKITEAIKEIGGVVLESGEVFNAEIESAVEYFYEEGINEEGLDLIIEDLGIEDFVDFILEDVQELTEAVRAARKARGKRKSFAQVKKEIDASDAAKRSAKKGEYSPAYAKKETDVTVYDDDYKPPAQKKPAAPK